MLKALFMKLSTSIGIIGGADGPTEIVVEKAAEGIRFSTEYIGEALLCSFAGMIGIFIVVGIIILSVSILNKIGGKKN